MKIACLQFAPQVGDVDNNLNRADAVLNRASPEDLEDLDLLVLPELAFTGYNFKSSQDILPYLEPSGSGISSLWARTVALRHNCTVLVGYPEKVEPTQDRATPPKYYSSAILVNGEGETIGNYRKSFLHAIDESWASESQDGFFCQELPRLGKTAMGICVDLNPYRLEAPWHAFELAFHILENHAHLVIVTMSWITREEPRNFSRMPQEPDMETLAYWVKRLEPLIRADRDEEIIVVFCNRSGVEEDAVYAGTSAVLGIRNGEVRVFGLLGRGVKELLVVDTDDAPFAKLVQRTEGEERESVPSMEAQLPIATRAPSHSPGSAHTKQEEASSRTRRSPQPKPATGSETPRSRKARPTITIPEHSSRIIEESPGVETPTAPSPTPLSLRPKLHIPQSRKPYQHTSTPYPHDDDKYHAYTGHVTLSRGDETPISPFFEESDTTAAKYYWVPHDQLLQTPLEPRSQFAKSEDSIVPSTLVMLPGAGERRKSNRIPPPPPPPPAPPGLDAHPELRSDGSIASQHSDTQSATSSSSEGRSGSSYQKADKKDDTPARPSSPKSRNASRSRIPDRRASGTFDGNDVSAIARRLEAINNRPSSAMGRSTPVHDGIDPTTGRPRSPKSRNVSRTRTFEVIDPVHDERVTNISQASIPIAASPSCFQGGFQRSQSGLHYRVGSFSYQQNRGDIGVPGSLPHSDNPSRCESRLDRPQSRAVSRGRQMISSAIASHDVRGSPQPGLERRVSIRSQPGERIFIAGSTDPDDEIVAIEEYSSSQCQVHGLANVGDHARTIRSATSDDEIIAIVGSTSPSCQLHGHGASPRSSPSSIDSKRLDQTETAASNDQEPPKEPPLEDTSLGTSVSVDLQHETAALLLFSKDAVEALNTSGTDSCPTMSGDSVRSLISSGGPSPSTPAFAPPTPKAMSLIFTDDDVPETNLVSPAPTNKTEPLTPFGGDLDVGLIRPKSAVW